MRLSPIQKCKIKGMVSAFRFHLTNERQRSNASKPSILRWFYLPFTPFSDTHFFVASFDHLRFAFLTTYCCHCGFACCVYTLNSTPCVCDRHFLAHLLAFCWCFLSFLCLMKHLFFIYIFTLGLSAILNVYALCIHARSHERVY